MKTSDLTYSRLILVCTNCRDDGRECCMKKGAEKIRHALKMACAELDPSIRVSRAGCLGNCLSGPTVVIQPDNIWLGEVRVQDVPEIINMLKSDR